LLSVAVAALILIVWHEFSVGWWIPLSPPLTGNLFTTGLTMAYMAYLEKKDRGVLMDLFKRNVSPGVAQSLWNQRMHFTQNGRPRPQMLTATILFTDLKNFTTTSEHLGPEALMEWLNGYFHVIVGEIDACGGVVMKYIGDAVMAAFGVPIPRGTEEEINQDAINAVRCALGMEKALAKLNAERVLTGAPKASMRVGIYTGHVVAGCLGSATRIEYTTIGDTTNTASRLESFDKDYEDPTLPSTDCRILIGEPTKQRIGDRFVTKLLGNLDLKGKKEKVTVYRVVSEKISIDEP